VAKLNERPPAPTLGSDEPARALYEREINAKHGGGAAYWPSLSDETQDRYRVRAGCPSFAAISAWEAQYAPKAAFYGRTPRRMFVLDIEPDYRKHDGRDMMQHCYRCGKALIGEPACTIRLEPTDGTIGDMLNAWVPANPAQCYYPIGSECMKRIPKEFRMNGRHSGWVLG
jgi:hypothetical protein